MWRKRSEHYCYLLFLTIVASSFACQDVEVVTRAGWNSRPAKWVVGLNMPVKHIFIAHTVTPECHNRDECSAQMRSMQNTHMDKLNWSDIGYNFVIGGDGRVYEGVGWSREGVHTLGWNAKSYGIGFVGNFMATRPNDAMLRAARKLTVCGVKLGVIAEDRSLHGARDGTCTDSPGTVLYQIIKQWPSFEGGPLPGYRC